MQKLRPPKTDWRQVERFISSAAGKRESARKAISFDEEAELQLAYEAMLKTSLGFMFSHGSRPRSLPGHHIAIIEFVKARIDSKHGGIIAVFDRIRRKRNLGVYDDRGFLSHQDAELAISTASSFIAIIRAEIAARKPRTS
ncbi:MAG: hypothetical protein WA823_02050 [Candidatus Acidiferrales bacterium]